MQLLTFGSRELKPNDQLHVNWKLAQARAAALALFRFSQVLSPHSKKIQFQKAGRCFFMINKYWFGASTLLFFPSIHKVSAGHIT